jgi:hypothetical protein
MSLQKLMKMTGMSKEQLAQLIDESEDADLAQLRISAGFETQLQIAEAIKQAFAQHGIDGRTMNQKNWSEYERGLATPFFSLKGWLVVCDLLKVTPNELVKAMDVTSKRTKRPEEN